MRTYTNIQNMAGEGWEFLIHAESGDVILTLYNGNLTSYVSRIRPTTEATLC